MLLFNNTFKLVKFSFCNPAATTDYNRSSKKKLFCITSAAYFPNSSKFSTDVLLKAQFAQLAEDAPPNTWTLTECSSMLWSFHQKLYDGLLMFRKQHLIVHSLYVCHECNAILPKLARTTTIWFVKSGPVNNSFFSAHSSNPPLQLTTTLIFPELLEWYTPWCGINQVFQMVLYCPFLYSLLWSSHAWNSRSWQNLMGFSCTYLSNASVSS